MIKELYPPMDKICVICKDNQCGFDQFAKQ